MGVVGPGNPGLWKSQAKASVFSPIRKGEGEGWSSWRCLPPLRLSSFESLDLKSKCVARCVYVGWGHSFCDLRGKALRRGKTGDSREASSPPRPHLPSFHHSHHPALTRRSGHRKEP